MKIALYISGKVRTLFYRFRRNIDLLRDRYPNCEIDVYYSFWDCSDRVEKINDPWHFPAENYSLPVIDEENINSFFHLFKVKSVGEIESSEKMYEIMESSPFAQKGLSSQYYKMERVVDKYFKEGYDLYFRMRSDILIHDVPPLDFFDDDTVAINMHYWYNQPYDGLNCNEMILVTKAKHFPKCNQLYRSQNELAGLKEQYGEFITGYYFGSLDEVNLKTFDFKYRVVR